MAGVPAGDAGGALSGGVGGAMRIPCVSDVSRTGLQSGAFAARVREGRGADAEAVDRGTAGAAGAGAIGGGGGDGGGGAAFGVFLPCEPAAGAGAEVAGGLGGWGEED